MYSGKMNNMKKIRARLTEIDAELNSINDRAHNRVSNGNYSILSSFREHQEKLYSEIRELQLEFNAIDHLEDKKDYLRSVEFNDEKGWGKRIRIRKYKNGELISTRIRIRKY